MGLPPPREGRWLTARNYGLTESMKMAIMNMLPKGSSLNFRLDDAKTHKIDPDTARRMSHLAILVKGLLPADNAPFTLSSRVQSLVGKPDDDSDEEDSFDRLSRTQKMNLRELRLSNIDAGTHDHTWSENMGIPSHKFSVGDFGYIPDGGKDFNDFVLLGNVLKEALAGFAIATHARGFQWNPNDIPFRPSQMDPFHLPGDATCWTLVVLPHAKVNCQIVHSAYVECVSDAWKFLMQNGKGLAVKHGIKPGDLILVTQAGTNQDFYIHDFNTQPPLAPRPPQAFNRHPVHQPFGNTRPGFNAHGHMNRYPHMSPFANNPPAIMYLITSLTQGFEPYWSHAPVAVPAGAPRPNLNRGWTYQIGWWDLASNID
ncbi:hypothetical protein H0H92_001833 [Tricholoma furcatifolium]|nr:hypothetical protein H0H92_001833 [Tricholoma furcatifolium]